MFSFIKQPWRNSDLPVSIQIHSINNNQQNLSFTNVTPNSISFSKYAVEFKYSSIDNTTSYNSSFSLTMPLKIIKFYQLEEVYEACNNQKLLSFTLHFHVILYETLNDENNEI